MTETEILMALLVIACLGFASWIVVLSRKVKMLRYSLENTAAVLASLNRHYNEHIAIVDRKLGNLGQ